jgi:hypothetical protein
MKYIDFGCDKIDRTKVYLTVTVNTVTTSVLVIKRDKQKQLQADC